MSIYLGENLVSGVATPVEGARNVGQIVQSTIPLSDAGLHLLDGGVIQRGSYTAFVDYIAGLYNADPTANYFTQPHGEIDWVQPIATGSTTAIGGGDMVITTSNEYSTYNSWKAMDGIKSGTDMATGWGTNNTGATQWWQLKLPYQIRIFGLKGYQRYDTTPANANTIGRFYTSSDMTTPIGDTYTNASGINWNVVEVSGIPNTGIVTDTIYFQKTGGGNYGGLGELEITATVVGTERTAEQVWQELVDKYGVCGKFVYDSTNNTVRLPKITGFTEGAIDPTVLGDLTEAGLPNITGDIIPTSHYSGVVATNAFYATARTGSTVTRASAAGDTSIIGLDASRSSSIYGNSDTVQPQSINVLYYIVIATSTKTDIEVDIDEIATDLNGKVNIQDLSTIHCVVDTYQNGTDWYRIYDDGWVEQGGIADGSSATINLLKSFTNTNYSVQLRLNYNSTGTITGNYWCITTKNTNNFILGAVSTALPFDWYAYGYGA